MNEAIIKNWNDTVKPDDDVYMLGDLCFGDATKMLGIIERLNGRIHLCVGNHDSDIKLKIYRQAKNIVDIQFAYRLRLQHHSVYLTHYPTLVGSHDDLFEGGRTTLNIHGHIHSKEPFTVGMHYAYNVSCDAIDCTPQSLDEVVTRIRNRIKQLREIEDTRRQGAKAECR